jgi:hypothetical protein
MDSDQFPVGPTPTISVMSASIRKRNMTFHFIEEAEMERLSDLNNRASMYTSAAVALITAGVTLILEPVFMGLKTEDLPALAVLVSWRLGPLLLAIGIGYVIAAAGTTRAARRKRHEIKTSADQVPVTLELTAKQEGLAR